MGAGAFDITLGLSIGFLPVSVWDAVDVALVSYLIYRIIRLVRGSIASNIFIGIVTLYVLYFVVGQLGMQMLRAILAQFVAVGVIVVIVIFQPEIRRFLVVVGNTTLKRRAQVVRRMFGFGESRTGLTEESLRQIAALKSTLTALSRRKTGALIVVSDNVALEPVNTVGTRINGELTSALLRTIFDKHTPLHDGAVLVERGSIVAAGCVLPITDRVDLPQNLGLRHRAAIGFSERTRSLAFVVSEETGRMSVAKSGKLIRKLNEKRLEGYLREAMGAENTEVVRV